MADTNLTPGQALRLLEYPEDECLGQKAWTDLKENRRDIFERRAMEMLAWADAIRAKMEELSE